MMWQQVEFSRNYKLFDDNEIKAVRVVTEEKREVEREGGAAVSLASGSKMVRNDPAWDPLV